MTHELKLMSIRPIHINTFYYDPVSEDTAYNRLRSLNSLGYDRYVLVVEKISFQKYILIEGFREYSALKFLQQNKPVFCNVINTTNEKERLLRILIKVITLETTSWYFKYLHIQKLMVDYHMKPEEISNAINQPLSKINKFLYRSDIPEYIRELADLNGASNILLNKIASSRVLHDTIRRLLFTRAVLPQNHPHRLKERQLEHVKLFCRNLSLYESEVNNPKFISELTETLLGADAQLLFNWQSFLINIRKQNETNDHFNYWDNDDSNDDTLPLQ